MASLIGLIKRNVTLADPPTVSKDPTALRFGLLGTSRIAVNAVIRPARSHPEVVVTAVASRDPIRAAHYAQQHSIATVYAGERGYYELLEDTAIDVIYNALPNGMHFEWTVRALKAGKHVLLEKPCASTAAEARVLFSLAASKDLVLLEGYAYTMHPSIQRVKEIVDSGELGKIKTIHSELCIPKGIIPKNDIREDYKLAGGATMDLGLYCIDVARYITSADPLQCLSAIPTKHGRDANIDRRMEATYAFPQNITVSTLADIQLPGWGPFGILPHMVKNCVTITLEGGEIHNYGTFLPHFFHTIKVKPAKGLGSERVEKAYKFPTGLGEEWWASYRYQLEAFVEKLRGREPQAWRTADESICQIEWLEQTYLKSGLPIRPASTFDPAL